MASININGVTITGNSISVRNKQFYVDGKKIDIEDGPSINIEVHGDVDQINADVCDTVTVQGKAGRVKTMSGDVRCGDVSGSVKTMSGDVSCGRVAGDVSTMSGDVRGVERG